MISTQQLLYKLDLRLNKSAANEHQSIPLEDKILALNEAQIKLIKKKLNTNNIYKEGYDSFKKRYEDLQSLAVVFEEMNVTESSNIGYSAFEGDLTTLEHNYFIPLDIFANCKKGTCLSRAVYITRIVKHGDLSILMSNSNYIPSFEYQDGLAIISDNKIIVLTDGTFDVNNIFLSYLRYPVKIDSAGYINFDGTASTNQDCELVDYLEDELLDLATMELAMNTENTPVVQYTDIRNKTDE